MDCVVFAKMPDGKVRAYRAPEVTDPSHVDEARRQVSDSLPQAHPILALITGFQASRQVTQ